ncbi:MAG: hypothetical protein QOD81_4170 [Solirubrobacteraceae bacterium]|jgi:hypothetical protein|nr:hypothetical protein [Solirubrobacteraceae bacterium]
MPTHQFMYPKVTPVAAPQGTRKPAGASAQRPPR